MFQSSKLFSIVTGTAWRFRMGEPREPFLFLRDERGHITVCDVKII